MPRERAAKVDERSLEGRTLGGFAIEEKLGAGGMVAVYRARQVSSNRRVAVKILDPVLSAADDVATRFRREAAAAARLDHPHVVQPIDCGEVDGLKFFAMELMDGGSLGARIKGDGPLPERAVLEILRAVGLALLYARELSLITAT